MNTSTQLSIIASIMKSKNKNGTTKKSKSTMTVPTLTPELMLKFKQAFIKIFADNQGEWLRWSEVSQTVVMNDKEMTQVSKEHKRNNCLGPTTWTMVMKELVKTGILETSKVKSHRYLRSV